MEPELFLVSAIYWISLLVVGLWLNRRFSRIQQRLSNLEQGEEGYAK